jgi:hypothetical protein
MRVLAPPLEGTSAQDNPYATRYFLYDHQAGTVTCPRGEVLAHEGHTMKRQMRVDRYRCRCRDCPVRGQCTRDPKGRQIEVWPHTPTVQTMRTRLRDPALARQWSRRGEIIEPRFGHIKQHEGFRRWTVWGLEGVRAQWTLMCATLNLRVLYRRWKERQRGGPPQSGAARAVAAATLLRSWAWSRHNLRAYAPT